MDSELFQNSTFKGADPTWANACVGNNGNPQAIDYAQGFSAAANVLLDKVIEARGRISVDNFIYPICFNMRHALELHLKDTIARMEVLSEYRTKLPHIDREGSHDIGRLWTFIEQNAPALDRRYVYVIVGIQEYIRDVASIDPSGQVFRYPFNRDNNKHLTDVAIINVGVLKTRFNQLEGWLADLHNLNMELLDEYRLGSHTRHLSREDIFCIAAKLPVRASWRSDEFETVRTEIRAEFSISQKEFSRALNIIQEHYEMAQFIEAPLSLATLNLAKISCFFDFWIRHHDIDALRNPKPVDDVVSFSDVDSSEMFEAWRRASLLREECWGALSIVWDSADIAELQALFYFFRDIQYSENFKKVRSLYFSELSGPVGMDTHRKNALIQIFDKTNALENVLNSLHFLGLTAILDALVVRFELGECIDSILETSKARKWRPKGSAGGRLCKVEK